MKNVLRLFRAAVRPPLPGPHRLRSRPQLEALDEREVPARLLLRDTVTFNEVQTKPAVQPADVVSKIKDVIDFSATIVKNGSVSIADDAGRPIGLNGLERNTALRQQLVDEAALFEKVGRAAERGVFVLDAVEVGARSWDASAQWKAGNRDKFIDSTDELFKSQFGFAGGWGGGVLGGAATVEIGGLGAIPGSLLGAAAAEYQYDRNFKPLVRDVAKLAYDQGHGASPQQLQNDMADAATSAVMAHLRTTIPGFDLPDQQVRQLRDVIGRGIQALSPTARPAGNGSVLDGLTPGQLQTPGGTLQVVPGAKAAFVQTPQGDLKVSPDSGTGAWPTIHAGVSYYAAYPDGRVIDRTTDGRVSINQKDNRGWQPIDGNTADLRALPNGTLFDRSPDGNLRVNEGKGAGWQTIDTGVSGFLVTADGAVFSVSRAGDLKVNPGTGTGWQTIDRGVTSAVVLPNGRVVDQTAGGQVKVNRADGAGWVAPATPAVTTPPAVPTSPPPITQITTPIFGSTGVPGQPTTPVVPPPASPPPASPPVVRITTPIVGSVGVPSLPATGVVTGTLGQPAIPSVPVVPPPPPPSPPPPPAQSSSSSKAPVQTNAGVVLSGQIASANTAAATASAAASAAAAAAARAAAARANTAATVNLFGRLI